MRAAQVHSTAPDRQASEVTAADACAAETRCATTEMHSPAAEVHPTATELHPPAAEVATSTAEMHATTAEVTTATAEVTAAATKAAACGFRGQRRRKGHHRRKQDRANSNSVAFHEYLPACECSAPLGCEHLSATPLEYRSIRPPLTSGAAWRGGCRPCPFSGRDCSLPMPQHRGELCENNGRFTARHCD